MARNGSTLLSSTVLSTKIVGAGGWMTGLDGAADGTLIGRGDTAGAFILGPNASEWVRAFTPGVTVANADISADFGCNVFDAAVCWSNSEHMQQATMGHIWVKEPGQLWAKTPFPRHSVNANSNNRPNGKPLAIDPANPNVAFYGNHLGRYFTTNKWQTHTVISNSTLPLPSGPGGDEYRDIILFDRSSTVTGSGSTARTQRIYWFVPGTGTYRSNDAGANWTFIAGPTSAGIGKVRASDGVLILTGLNTAEDGPVNRWNGTAWTAATLADGGAPASLHAIEFDVSVTNLVHGIQIGGAYANSTDGGVTWGALTGMKTNDPLTVDIPWQIRDTNFRSIGDMRQHPVSRRLRISCGIGCWDMRTPPTALTVFGVTPQIVTHGLSLGIENMVCGALFNALDGTTDVTMQDKQHQIFTAEEIGQKFTKNYGPNRGKILRGISADCAPDDSKFWAATTESNDGADCAYTQDGGETWIERPQLQAQTGGAGGGPIVVVDKDTWLRSQFTTYPINSTTRAKNALYITRNARAASPTWTEVVIGNGNATALHLDRDKVRIPMFKDPWNPTEAYVYNSGDVDNPNGADNVASRGIFRVKVNPGDVAVTRLRDTRVWANTNKDAFHLKMRHGGKARTMLICGGDNALSAYRGVISGDTLTLTALGGTDNLGIGTKFNEVYSVSAGKGRYDSTEPCAYVMGSRGTVDAQDDGADFSKFGVWESRDLWTAAPGAETWERIDQFPANTLPSTTNSASGSPYIDMIASMHKYRTLTFSTGGMGAVHRKEQYRRRAV